MKYEFQLEEGQNPKIRKDAGGQSSNVYKDKAGIQM